MAFSTAEAAAAATTATANSNNNNNNSNNCFFCVQISCALWGQLS
jgi:hypothetical protein